MNWQADKELQMQFIQTKARIWLPTLQGSLPPPGNTQHQNHTISSTIWQEPHHIIHNVKTLKNLDETNPWRYVGWRITIADVGLSVQCTRKHQVHSITADVWTWSAVTDWADVWWSTMPRGNTLWVCYTFTEAARRSLSWVQDHLHQALQHQKQCYDRKSSGGRYKVGDSVLYSPALFRGQASKFHRQWRGP